MDSRPSTLPITLPAFSNYEHLLSPPSLDADQKQSNFETIESEIESLKTILNEQECFIHDKSFFPPSEPYVLESIAQVIKLSLIPNSQKKFVLTDVPKGISVELRCLPAIELYVILPEFYPSSGMPLLLLTT